MPADPNARRDKTLEAILGAVNKGNKLLEAQNKILEKMERYARPSIVTNHTYLERSNGGTVDGGTVDGGTDSSSSGEGLERGLQSEGSETPSGS